MTQVSLGDCQHAHFSPTFFTWFQNDFTWSRIFINWPALQAVLADVQFFTHPVIRTSSRITSTKSFFPFVQGKQGGKQTAMKSLWDALHRCSSHLPSCVSGYTLLHYHGIILFFSRPLFAPVFLLACFLPPWLAASASPIANSKNAVIAYIFSHPCRSRVTLTCLQARWGGWEVLRCQQPPLWWAIGWRWQLLSLCGITGCWQHLLPLFRHHKAGTFDQASLSLAHTRVFTLHTFLFWAL